MNQNTNCPRSPALLPLVNFEHINNCSTEQNWWAFLPTVAEDAWSRETQAEETAKVIEHSNAVPAGLRMVNKCSDVRTFTAAAKARADQHAVIICWETTCSDHLSEDSMQWVQI